MVTFLTRVWSSNSPPLLRVSDASGELEVTEVGSYPLKRELLDTNVSSGCAPLSDENVRIFTGLPLLLGCLHSGHWRRRHLCVGG